METVPLEPRECFLFGVDSQVDFEDGAFAIRANKMWEGSEHHNKNFQKWGKIG